MSRCQEALEHLPDLFIYFDLCHSDHTKLHFPHFLGGLALPVPSWSGVEGGVAGKESQSCSGGMRGVIFSVNKRAGVLGRCHTPPLTTLLITIDAHLEFPSQACGFLLPGFKFQGFSRRFHLSMSAAIGSVM